MSPDLRSRVELRRARLAKNLEAIEQLRRRAPDSTGPDPLDLPGLVWLLQQSYSELEEIFKAIATHFGEGAPSSATWHRTLLDSMAVPATGREAVISQHLRVELDPYLTFRHFSRNATFPDIDWEKLAPLLDALPCVAARFTTELESFLVAHQP